MRFNFQQQKIKSMYENDESSKAQIFGLWVYKKLAISNSSFWAIHFVRAENVINWEMDGPANLWEILHKEKQMRDQIKCYFS